MEATLSLLLSRVVTDTIVLTDSLTHYSYADLLLLDIDALI